MPSPQGAERLARIARPLQPERAPWWVSQPAGNTPAQGWWWVAPGTAHPMLLGHNHIVAELALARLGEAVAA